MNKELLADIIPIIHMVCAEHGDLTEESMLPILNETFLSLERDFLMYDELEMVKVLKSVLRKSISSDECGSTVSSSPHRKVIEPIRSDIVSCIECNMEELSSESLRNTTVKQQNVAKKSTEWYSLFDFDDIPPYEPLEVTLDLLRQDPLSAEAFNKLIDIDVVDLMDHPQWLDLMKLLKISLLPSEANDSIKTSLQIHALFLQQMNGPQAVDLALNVVSALRSFWLVKTNGATIDNSFSANIKLMNDNENDILQMQLAIFEKILSWMGTVEKFGSVTSLSAVDTIIVECFYILSFGQINSQFHTKTYSSLLDTLLARTSTISGQSSPSVLSCISTWPMHLIPVTILNYAIQTGFLSTLVGKIQNSANTKSSEQRNASLVCSQVWLSLFSAVAFSQPLANISCSPFTSSLCRGWVINPESVDPASPATSVLQQLGEGLDESSPANGIVLMKTPGSNKYFQHLACCSRHIVADCLSGGLEDKASDKVDISHCFIFLGDVMDCIAENWDHYRGNCDAKIPLLCEILDVCRLFINTLTKMLVGNGCLLDYDEDRFVQKAMKFILDMYRSCLMYLMDKDKSSRYAFDIICTVMKSLTEISTDLLYFVETVYGQLFGSGCTERMGTIILSLSRGILLLWPDVLQSYKLMMSYHRSEQSEKTVTDILVDRELCIGLKIAMEMYDTFLLASKCPEIEWSAILTEAFCVSLEMIKSPPKGSCNAGQVDALQHVYDASWCGDFTSSTDCFLPQLVNSYAFLIAGIVYHCSASGNIVCAFGNDNVVTALSYVLQVYWLGNGSLTTASALAPENYAAVNGHSHRCDTQVLLEAILLLVTNLNRSTDIIGLPVIQMFTHQLSLLLTQSNTCSLSREQFQSLNDPSAALLSSTELLCGLACCGCQTLVLDILVKAWYPLAEIFGNQSYDNKVVSLIIGLLTNDDFDELIRDSFFFFLLRVLAACLNDVNFLEDVRICLLAKPNLDGTLWFYSLESNCVYNMLCNKQSSETDRGIDEFFVWRKQCFDRICFVERFKTSQECNYTLMDCLKEVSRAACASNVSCEDSSGAGMDVADGKCDSHETTESSLQLKDVDIHLFTASVNICSMAALSKLPLTSIVSVFRSWETPHNSNIPNSNAKLPECLSTAGGHMQVQLMQEYVMRNHDVWKCCLVFPNCTVSSCSSQWSPLFPQRFVLATALVNAVMVEDFGAGAALNQLVPSSPLFEGDQLLLWYQMMMSSAVKELLPAHENGRVLLFYSNCGVPLDSLLGNILSQWFFPLLPATDILIVTEYTLLKGPVVGALICAAIVCSIMDRLTSKYSISEDNVQLAVCGMEDVYDALENSDFSLVRLQSYLDLLFRCG